ncbi:MAG: hypothetical protein WAX04_10310, partial [Oscillospiraceae bacterium]
MNLFSEIIETIRRNEPSARDKGTAFEKLCKVYFENEPDYKDRYEKVWLWGAWQKYWQEKENKDPGIDTGIDLVAKTRGSDEYHAIQAKFFDKSTLYKNQIDSFFT